MCVCVCVCEGVGGCEHCVSMHVCEHVCAHARASKHAHRCLCLYVEEEVVEERGKKGRQDGHVGQLLLR